MKLSKDIIIYKITPLFPIELCNDNKQKLHTKMTVVYYIYYTIEININIYINLKNLKDEIML